MPDARNPFLARQLEDFGKMACARKTHADLIEKPSMLDARFLMLGG
jgi:hypothetical protein